MRIWYQSMTRMEVWGGYPAELRTILDQARSPTTDLHVAGITEVGGVGDQYRYLEFLETAEVLQNVGRAVQEGYDAILIGNIADPGLREAREIADIPVLGLCETAMHVACMMGASFGFVTINEKFTPRIVENVDRAGLRTRFAGAARMDIARLTDLGPAFEPGEAQDRTLAQFHAAAAALEDKGAEVIIPAGGVVMALLARLGIHATPGGVPVLNGITTLVTMGEAAVRLHRLMGGRFTSKKCLYAPPTPDLIDTFRTHYGPGIYPTVKGP